MSATLFVGWSGARANETKPDASGAAANGVSPAGQGVPNFSPDNPPALTGPRAGASLRDEKETAGTIALQATGAVLSLKPPIPLAGGFPDASGPLFAATPTFGELANATADSPPPGTDILHLPRFVVHGSRLPAASEILSTNGLKDQYLGPEAGLDRGLLNFYPLNWGSGAVSFALFGAVKNESRARDLFAAEERKRTNTRFRDMLDWEKLSASGGSDVKREIERFLGAQTPLPGK